MKECIFFKENQKILIHIRWVIVLVVPLLYYLSEMWPQGYDLYALLLYVAVNLLLTFRYYIKKDICKFTWLAVFCLDLIVISAMVANRGGIESENFNGYYLVLLEVGMLFGFRFVMLSLLLISVSYWVAISTTLPQGYEWRVLFIRLIYFLLVGVLTSILAFSRKKNCQSASIDSLTRTYNRSYFGLTFEDEFKKANKMGTDLSIVMVDLDNFKDINDNYGHGAGDAVLEEIAVIIKDNLRDIDIVGRYGGEEFVIVLPGVSCESAKKIAERIRESVANNNFEIRNNIGEQYIINLTISCGIAYLPSDIEDTNQLLDKADNCLYHAKKMGKNRVVAFTG